MCYGDSNTWGYIPWTGLRFPFHKRWSGIAQQELTEEFVIIEEGLPGRTTVLDDPEYGGRNGKTSLLSSIRHYQPLAMVIVVLGTNDLKTHFNRTAAQIALGVAELGTMVLANPQAFELSSPKLLLVAPPPVLAHEDNVILFKEAEEKSRWLGREIQKVAQRLPCEFLDAGQFIQSSGLDGLHWDEAAHRKLGVAIAQRVREMFKGPEQERAL